MARATQAIINLHALRENYQLVKQLAPSSRAFAVIKANAYGHGLLQVANALSATADGFAVACIEEAQQLRQGGILLPILVLEGLMDEAQYQIALDLDLELVVHQPIQMQWLKQQQAGRLQIWLKVDTGMHRLGFALQDVPALVSDLRGFACVADIHLISHFARADEVGHDFNQQQLTQMQTLSPMKLDMSMSNSAAILSLPKSHGHTVRPGIMLYGASPLQNKSALDLNLKPVMTLQSEVLALHQVAAGESVGYGQAYTAEKDSTIAVVSIGYGDGYPRSAKQGTPVLIRGKKWPLVGRVSMDMITVDVTGSDIELSDSVILWGTGLEVDEVASHCDTLSYELFCRLTSRVTFYYLGGG